MPLLTPESTELRTWEHVDLEPVYASINHEVARPWYPHELREVWVKVKDVPRELYGCEQSLWGKVKADLEKTGWVVHNEDGVTDSGDLLFVVCRPRKCEWEG